MAFRNGHSRDAQSDRAGSLSKDTGPESTSSSPSLPAKGESAGSERVRVVVRVRPPLRDDETQGAFVGPPTEDGRLTLHRPDAPVQHSDYMFDKVVGPSASQKDVYDAAVREVVDDVLKGYNGTVMAYGQTGAGKTYTLGNTERSAIGMIPRAIAEVFKKADEDPFHDYSITMSYIQIYMELIQDLLNPSADNLMIREDLNHGVYVAGTLDVPIKSLEECLHYLELGERNRVFAFTHLNAHSSRSHVVTMVTVVKSRKYLTPAEKQLVKKAEKEGVVTQKVKVGKLYLVDLAGSERLKKSRSVGLRASEAKSINLSLTCLGMCINARANEQTHVPFRESKLTRLLQESLGGNAKTTLLLCVSDVVQHSDETLQSLQFGSRAMHVSNRPQVNERLDYRLLSSALQSTLDATTAETHQVEVALYRTEEERDQLQADLEEQKVHFAGIIDALRREAADNMTAAQAAAQAAMEAAHWKAQQVQRELDQRHAEAQLALAAQLSSLERHQQDLTAAGRTVADLQEQLRQAQVEAERLTHTHSVAVAALDERLRQAQVDKERMALTHYDEISEMNGHIQAMKVEYDSHASSQKALIDELRAQVVQEQALNASLSAAGAASRAEVAQLVADKQALSDVQGELLSELALVRAQHHGLHTALMHLQQAASDLVPLHGRQQPTSPAPQQSAPDGDAAGGMSLATPNSDLAFTDGSPRSTAFGTAHGAAGVPITSTSAVTSTSTSPHFSHDACEPDSVSCLPAYQRVTVSFSDASSSDSPMLGAQLSQRGLATPAGSAGDVVKQSCNPAFGTRLSAEGPVGVSEMKEQVASIHSLMQQAQELRSAMEASAAASSKQATVMQGRISALEACCSVHEMEHAALSDRLAAVLAQAKDAAEEAAAARQQEAEASQQLAELQAAHEVLAAQLAAMSASEQAAGNKLMAHRRRQQQAVERRLTVGRTVSAALCIQRAYRRWKTLALTKQLEADQQLLGLVQQQHDQLHRAAHSQSAQLGAAMVRQSLGVVQEAVDAVLKAFLVTGKDLAAHRRVQQLSTSSRSSSTKLDGPDAGAATSLRNMHSFVHPIDLSARRVSGSTKCDLASDNEA